MRGPLIYGVLLVAVLLVSYQNWTAVESVEKKQGTELMWSENPENLQEITYSSEKSSPLSKRETLIRIERKSGVRPYLWATESTYTEVYPPKKTTAKTDAGPEEVEEERKVIKTTKTNEFPVGKKGAELFADLSTLYAFHKGAAPTDAQRKEFGFDQGIKITLRFKNGSRTLLIGKRLAGSHEYKVLDEKSGFTYVIGGATTVDRLKTTRTLRLSQLHLFDEKKVLRASLQAGGKIVDLVSLETDPAPSKSPLAVMRKKKRSWALADTPDKVDQTMANLVRVITGLRPVEYAPTLEPTTLQMLARLDFQDKEGQSLGYVLFYKKNAAADTPTGENPKTPPKAEYYIMTEETIVLGKVRNGKKVEEDLTALLQ